MCIDFGHYSGGERIICRGREEKRTFNLNKMTSGQDFIKIIYLFFFHKTDIFPLVFFIVHN